MLGLEKSPNARFSGRLTTRLTLTANTSWNDGQVETFEATLSFNRTSVLGLMQDP